MVSVALAYAIRREGPEEFSHKISCVLLRELAFSLGNDWASEIFGEGMLIIGWVAMWRPLEIFLYELGTDPPSLQNSREACGNESHRADKADTKTLMCTERGGPLSGAVFITDRNGGALPGKWRRRHLVVIKPAIAIADTTAAGLGATAVHSRRSSPRYR